MMLTRLQRFAANTTKAKVKQANHYPKILPVQSAAFRTPDAYNNKSSLSRQTVRGSSTGMRAFSSASEKEESDVEAAATEEPLEEIAEAEEAAAAIEEDPAIEAVAEEIEGATAAEEAST